jgi:SAM-dependent methyltransferase
MAPRQPSYLVPYSRARRAPGVRALLWDGPHDQTVRFDAIVRACPLDALHVLDVGCGPADFLGYLHQRDINPARYTGLEAQTWLARAARRRRYRSCSIVEGDFVKEPGKLFVGADVVVFSGSLNLLTSRQFYRSVCYGWEAAREWLAFNFLCTPDLAGAQYLVWHRRKAVLALARRLGAITRMDDTYEAGDCLVVMRKRGGTRSSSAPKRAGAIQSP